MSLNGNTDDSNGYNTKIKNGITNDANMVKAVVPPIGSVMAWLKTLTGTPALPDGWVECDGATISDSDSPYNGTAVPDLNASSGTARFLRGATASGATGGAETHNHSLSGTGIIAADSNQLTTTTTQGSSLPSYYSVVWIIRIK